MHTLQPERPVVGFDEIDRTQVAEFGGKGANLGELTRIDGIRVPPGFCVSAGVYRRAVAADQGLDGLLDRLSQLGLHDRAEIRAVAAEIRQALERTHLPGDIATAVIGSVTAVGAASWAVRSSATAEDLPGTSFAGQHDSYLHVPGEAVLAHIVRCWGSLFTERAVTYRLRNGFDHRRVAMAVVVQSMVPADAAGVLFTADPVSGNRRVVTVEAVPGIGESLVGGLATPDVHTVRDGEIVGQVVATAGDPAVADAQVLHLVDVGRRIEAHFGGPQDVEWAIADDEIHVVQSRPITTLFPIPAVADDQPHVFVSVGHQQMMTDPMKPLGLSMWQLTAARPMHEAAGRLFVDVTLALAAPATHAGLIAMLGRGDPLIGDALQTIVDRGDFLPTFPDGPPAAPAGPGFGPAGEIETDATIVTELIDQSQAWLEELRRAIEPKSGVELLEFVIDDVEQRKSALFDPRSLQVIMAAIDAAWWLNDQLLEWLGEKNAADTLTLSVHGNVTSEMGLELLDVADAIRPHTRVVDFLRRVDHDGFIDELPSMPGGTGARDAILGYLHRYGMRCVGEIDITRPRWAERPSTLLPVILANIDQFEPGEHRRRFEHGQHEAAAKERDVIARLRALPDGERKAAATKRMIDRVRTFMGYREYPKYAIVSRWFIYKQALMAEGARLVAANVIRDVEDLHWLTIQEFRDVVATGRVDEQLIRERAAAFESYARLTPPRVITSDGEVVAGSYRREDVPADALLGLPVSAGVVEGRARVILDMADADLEPGDILVTSFTDPSWSPLFVAAAGLVTEVGGLMTHGAVVAREYGLPAVVGVDGATVRIEDGRRIRVDGTHGTVQLLPDD